LKTAELELERMMKLRGDDIFPNTTELEEKVERLRRNRASKLAG
jgi:hypothetical protein